MDPHSPTPIVVVKDLVAAYGEKTILDQISFKIYPGEIFMIIGGSGCGKTTLLHHMIGLLKPCAGDVLIDNQSISYMAEEKRLSVLRKIGVLYQSGALFGGMSLIKNVAIPLEELTALPPDAILEIAHDKLKMVGLEEFVNYFPAQISGGMKKRAAIARAMALDPKILFLDEPSSGLDPMSSSEIDQLIVNLSRILGITFVIVTHNVSSIDKIGERVVMLSQGKIVAEGVPWQLMQSSQPIVRKFFGCK